MSNLRRKSVYEIFHIPLLKLYLIVQQIKPLSEKSEYSSLLNLCFNQTQFEDLLDAILEYAKFPVDDLNMKNKPCLLICCPDINQAVKLFQHTLRHLNQVDLGCTVQELTNQNIDDERVSLSIKAITQYSSTVYIGMAMGGSAL